ncbi:MAG: UDP-N-acetylmuramoyl-tripeptide--D-alanyl-D-alanine ligase [bacterium]|uniref:UDP-N-acetylmuramoyl-tripeptide--D-alanyl-D-alanine ligase n=1 Tax=Candidatus Aphodosoma intestinipullorum TaxID=2840674 RepID=A0A940DJ72_9BACT|nr:UDP-N-acetylmuramoyl-tripeptide--D-alanyl-D-alanine ligase [Candidatus Aphodosoma intestinipullorum]
MQHEDIYRLFVENGQTVTTDSRVCPAGAIFFALKGEKFNGNKFAAKALENGCSYAVVDEAEYCLSERCILVDNALTALQQVAHLHRVRLATPVVGITGTNGKTTTKELTAAVLGRKYNVLYTEGNLNNHIGVPLTLLRLRPEHQMAVVEMGANHPGEIKALAAIASPDAGLITNVGKAHLEGFGSFEGVISTKCELYENLMRRGGTIFADAANPYLMPALDGYKPVTYGVGCTEADVCGRVERCAPFVTLSWWTEAAGKHCVDTHFIGAYNAQNMLAAIAVGLHYGVTPEEIDAALSEYEPKNNRSQLVRTGRNTLIVDAYNANPTSMEAAINNFRMMDGGHKVLILGDMLELGSQSEEEHARVVQLVRGGGFDDALFVGGEFARTAQGYRTFADVAQLRDWLADNRIDGATVLIKGSHGIGLQSIIDLF